MPTEMAGDLAASQPPKARGRQKRLKVPEEQRRRAARACDSCRKQKEKCEGGVPCRRCSHLQRMCQFHMSTPSEFGVSMSPSQRALDMPEGPDKNENLKSMECIIKHFLGDISFDTQNLRRIAETLQGEDLRLLNSMTDDELNNSEDLSIVDEDFVANELSDNTVHYSGEFSHWNFSKRIQQRIDKLSSAPNSNPFEIGSIKEYWRAKHLQSSGSTLLTVAQWFPPRPVSEFLISAFFKYAQTNYYYVEEEWTMAKLEKIYTQTSSTSSDDSPSWCILLMLLAIGTQFADLDSADNFAGEQSHDPSSSHDISAGDDVGLTLFKFAVQLIPDVITIASIESVQAFLLLGAYTLPLDAAGLSYTYVGVAIKMAIQNGMHRKYSGAELDMHTLEIRNRLWWTVFTLEKRICILHGRPVSISNSDTDAQLPNDLPNFRPLSQPLNFPNFQAMIKLTTQLESIATSIIKLRNSKKPSQADRLVELMQHSQNLKAWWFSLPDEVYCRDLDPRKRMFRPNVHLNLTFLLIQVFLGRPFLFTQSKFTTPSDQSTRSRAFGAISTLTADCVHAAYKILDLCQLLRDNNSLAGASYTEFSSCRAALLVILAHSLNERTERLRNALSNGMNLMRLMARGIDSAKSELSVIETLEKAISRLDARSISQAVNKDNEKSSGYEKYQTWAQLWKKSPPPFDGVTEASEQASTTPTPYNISDFSAASVEVNTSGFVLEGFSAYQQAMEGFDNFPIANDSYEQDLGNFPDISLEPGWVGYQFFDYEI